MNQHFMHFKSAFMKENEMWCVPAAVNWLVKINLEDWSVKGVCSLELDEEIRVEYIHQYGDYIWCTANIGVRVIRYHMQTGEIKHFKLAGEEQRQNRGTVFFDERLWILPIALPGKMYSFGLTEKKFEIHDSWEEQCLKQKITGRAVSFCQTENLIYMTLRDECKVIQFDLKEEMVKVKRLPGQKGLWCVFTAGDNIYATSFVKRMLFKWNKKEEEVKRIYCPYLQDKPYGRGLKFGNKIFLTDNETIDIFDPETEKMSPYNKIQKKLEEDEQGFLSLWPLFFIAMTYGKKYYLIPWGADILFEFLEEREEWRCHKVRMPENLFREYLLKKMDVKRLNMEGEFVVKDLLNFVMYSYNEQEQVSEGQIGDEIYRCVL